MNKDVMIVTGAGQISMAIKDRSFILRFQEEWLYEQADFTFLEI